MVGPAGLKSPPVWACAVAVAIASLLLSVTLALTKGFPGPVVQDEFSYLLAGDTIAHGRLTNLPHPMRRYFQSFHVLTTPTYASKYPPGQGIVLAIGQWLGEPAAGVWLATAVLAGLCVWAAAGVAGRSTAVHVGLAVAVHPQVVEWDRTFWGGTLAAIGSVVLIGGTLRRRPVLVGVAAGVLLLTRPYEGAAAVLVALPLAASRSGDSSAKPHAATRVQFLGIAALATLPFVLFTAYDNYRVTGSVAQLPYLLYERQYAAAPPLLVTAARPVPPGIPVEMRDYAERVELPHYFGQRAAVGRAVVEKLSTLVHSVAGVGGWVGWLPLVLLVGLVDRRTWRPAVLIAGVVGATLLSNWTRSQYVAPAVGGLVVYVAALCRTRIGAGVLSVVAVTWLTISVRSATVTVTQRDRVEAALSAEPGKQLVIVKYLPGHRPDDEWVYNGADIDGAKIVWARDLGDDAPLLQYYRDRSVWEVSIDAEKAVPTRIRN